MFSVYSYIFISFKNELLNFVNSYIKFQPNRSSQTRNSCLGSFQVNDIPTNNDRKSWEHVSDFQPFPLFFAYENWNGLKYSKTNGSNQDWRNSTKKYFKVKPKQIPVSNNFWTSFRWMIKIHNKNCHFTAVRFLQK